MSGTSADGIDAVVVEFADHCRPALLAHREMEYPQEIRELVLTLCMPGGADAAVISAANYMLGELLAEAALRVMGAAGLDRQDLDAVASHGQTIWHQPEAAQIAGREVRSTLQIGEAAVIAERTGLKVISDFRAADMAAGGQGAPLTPFADYVLFRDERISRAVQNIGGIANVTFLPAGCTMQRVIAFDTGPGNMLIDAAVGHLTGAGRAYDRDGALAGAGIVRERLLARLMSHPFLAQPPPKSTGREAFGEHFLRELLAWPEAEGVCGEDLAATLTAFTAASIAESYRRFLPNMPEQVILGGGGSRNQTLTRMLKERLGPSEVLLHEDFGIPAKAKEAMAFAILAAETLRGRPSNVPSATGAMHRAILGKVSFPPP